MKLSEAIRSKDSEIVSLTHQILQISESLRSEQGLRKDSDEKYNLLAHQYEDIGRKMEQMKSIHAEEMNSLNQQLSSWKDQLSKAQEESERWQSKLNATIEGKDREVVELKNEIDRLKGMVRASEDTIRQNETVKTQMQHQQIVLENELIELRSTYEVIKPKLLAAEQKCSEFDKQAGILQSQEAQIAELQGQNEKLLSMIRNEESIRRECEVNMARLMQSQKHFENECERLRKECDQLKTSHAMEIDRFQLNDELKKEQLLMKEEAERNIARLNTMVQSKDASLPS